MWGRHRFGPAWLQLTKRRNGGTAFARIESTRRRALRAVLKAAQNRGEIPAAALCDAAVNHGEPIPADWPDAEVDLALAGLRTPEGR